MAPTNRETARGDHRTTGATSASTVPPVTSRHVRENALPPRERSTAVGVSEGGAAASRVSRPESPVIKPKK